MKSFESVLSTHPFPATPAFQNALLPALRSLSACVEACTSCADACLAEKTVAQLRRCIRLNLDCADVCTVTARVLTRQTESTGDLLRAQLHVCALACDLCATECQAHRQMHEHCLHCAHCCRKCQETCNFLLGEIDSSGTSETGIADELDAGS